MIRPGEAPGEAQRGRRTPEPREAPGVTPRVLAPGTDPSSPLGQGPDLSVARARGLLPPVESLRPLLDHLMRAATPDRALRWAASGELATLVDRRVDPLRLARDLPALLEEVRSRAEESLALGVALLEREARGDREGAALQMAREGERLAGAGRIREAEGWVEGAVKAAEGVSDRTRVLPVYLAAARVARLRGALDRAAETYREALTLAREGKEPGVMLTAMIGLGNLEVDRGRWARAEARYAEAETLLDALEAKEAEAAKKPKEPIGAKEARETEGSEGSEVVAEVRPRPERWHLALNRSILAREEGELERAWQLLLEADGIARDLGAAGARAIVENARGQILLAMREPEAAEVAFRRGLAAAEHPDARVTIGVNLAEARLAAGHPLAAGETARAAEAEALRGGVVARLPEVYRVLGEILAAGRVPEAFVLFERALELVDAFGLPQVERARILEAWARVEEAGEERPGFEGRGSGEGAVQARKEAEERARERRAEARTIREALHG